MKTPLVHRGGFLLILLTLYSTGSFAQQTTTSVDSKQQKELTVQEKNHQLEIQRKKEAYQTSSDPTVRHQRKEAILRKRQEQSQTTTKSSDPK